MRRLGHEGLRATLDRSRVAMVLPRRMPEEGRLVKPRGVEDRVPSLPRRALTALSEREREVYALVRERWSTSQVAEKLGISPHTVLAHVKMVRMKLRVAGYIP